VYICILKKTNLFKKGKKKAPSSREQVETIFSTFVLIYPTKINDIKKLRQLKNKNLQKYFNQKKLYKVIVFSFL